jgi:23S rRNA (pseudouridine1915-N3)-methyltransferase
LKITLLCVGKLGRGAEGGLAADWATRATAVGRAHGLGPVEIVEVESRKPGKTAEGQALLDRLDGAHLIACDEHGATSGSRDFAALLARLRDDSVRSLAFAVGGADGLDEAVLSAARGQLAFGPQTWPHALVRAMLAEQIYRAASIMAGLPYHRD